LTLRHLILELAGLEDDIRVHHSTRHGAEGSAWVSELVWLKLRQRVILHELRRRARRRGRLRPGRLDPPPTSDVPREGSQFGSPRLSAPLGPTG
jgi:hypothetical protein